AEMQGALAVLVLARTWLQERGDRYRRMVHQPLTNAGAARAYLDAKVAKMPDRPDPGPQQHRRRMDGAAAQDHLVAAKFRRLAFDHRTNADAARVLEQKLRNLCIGNHRQIVALPYRRAEIADSGGDAPIVQI